MFKSVYCILICLLLCPSSLTTNIIVTFPQQASINGTSATDTDAPEIDDAELVSVARNLGIYIYSLDSNVSISAEEFCQDLTDNGIAALCDVDQTATISAQSGPITFTSNDPDSSQQYSLTTIGLANLWNQNIVGGSQVKVCVVDTGLDTTHPDIQQNLWTNPNPGTTGVDGDIHGAAFINGVGSSDVADTAGHGTLVSGIIAATCNNGQGIAGINQNVTLIPCRFMGASGNGQLSDAVSCFNYCAANNVHIINTSWGQTTFSAVLVSGLNALNLRGIILTASAGNSGVNTDSAKQYPSGYSATLSNIVSVGAIDQQDHYWDVSNYGPNTTTLAAPGVDIIGLGLAGRYVTESGTSFSAPHVAGSAALLLAYLSTQNINIDTSLVTAGPLVTGALINGTTAFPTASDRTKSAHGYLYLPSALSALNAALNNNKASNVSGLGNGAIGFVIGILLASVVFVLIIIVYRRTMMYRYETKPQPMVATHSGV